MATSSASNSGGIGFLGLLAVLFIALKLTHFIDWSWWYVLMPLWLPAGVGLAVAAFALGMHLWLNVWPRRSRKERV